MTAGGAPEPAPGVLYLIGTPIGNVEDLSPRALRVMGAVTVLAAEDTRRTQGLLARFSVRRAMISYHDHNKDGRTPELIARLRAGDSVAIVSDAGSPGISDPAYTLVRAAVAASIPVLAVPGPSSAICALEVSGLPTDRFGFEGFLPRRAGRRRARIEELRNDPRTLIFFESPHRIRAAVTDLLEGFGDRPASLSRELTKKFEETRRGTLRSLLEWLEAHPPRGEFVLVVGGATGDAAGDTAQDGPGDGRDAGEEVE